MDNVYDIIIRFDGGSRGNPGIAGAGAVLLKNNGEEVACVSVELDGIYTNNQSEYVGLIEGMTLAIEHGFKNVSIEGDSLLIVNQINGKFKCKSDSLKSLFNEASILIKKFNRYEIKHIYRKYNTRADELANIAMDSIQHLT